MTPNNSLTLLVLAAGLGSRSGGAKQIEGLGPSGETITDYSIYDALRCGFDRAVFIVRQDILELVKEKFLPRWSEKIAIDFVVQSMESCIPLHLQNPTRTKPWGTGHALLCARDAIHTPFAVINADDFYGQEAFQSLANHFAQDKQEDHAMVGFKLKHVLSAHGSVSRGCGDVDAAGYLKSLTEQRTIVQEGDKIISRLSTGDQLLDPETPTSMNCWGFRPNVFQEADHAFTEFLQRSHTSPDAEFYIPVIVDHMLSSGRGRVKVLSAGQTWFGVTYKEDKQTVADRLREMVGQGIYPERLS
ncbi:MAG: sugar phosphate nucleotidyltransferase [Planctomycetota bacterium]|nr:sugar phosphate nucleotidyltransferase [Planctomycetota bacterium]